MKNKSQLGIILGLIAVTSFGLTLPMTRLAVSEMDPILVGTGRALLAAIIAIFILWIKKAKIPTRRQSIHLCIVGVCISISFPLLVAYAMQSLPASHGAIVIGLLPMATTFCISLMKHEKPSKAFWLASFLGAGTVVGYSWLRSGGGFQVADLLLLATIVVGSIGYAFGAVLAKQIGGMNVMCWALVYMIPFLAAATIPQLIHFNPAKISWPVWGAFLYASIISQLFGMALWYKALSLGSIVRVSQVQLLQPFLTIVFAGMLFGERIDLLTWIASIIVILSIQISRMSSVEMNVKKISKN